MPAVVLPAQPILSTTTKGNSYPAIGSAAVSVTAGGSNATGSWTEVVPASTITNAISLTGVTVTDASNVGGHVVVQVGTGAGAAEVLVASGAGGAPNSSDGFFVPIYPPYRVAANVRVAVRMANSQATGRSYAVRLHYADGTV